ncbi:MAG TPA: methyltransferase domain-containing protein [Pyrinomonadaceae bacterium]|nr:methyltransferase domain-containing protein [Pyrinomonadaceae bacterium]
MPDRGLGQERLAQSVRAMYNAHPFPNRYNTLASRSDERFERIYREFLRIPLDELKGKTFLDAGCGTGENTWSWRRFLDPSVRIVAVDLSEASITIARQRGADQPLQPPFAVASLLDLALPANSVDVAFCSGVLGDASDPDRAFRELTRVLKQDGYMILVLYHRYGRALHGLRRAVVDLLERDDIDRRARLGGLLFGRSMRKLAEAEQVPYEGLLYDQFGHPCETRHSVGQALAWFKQAGIQYLGTWPPVEWSQLGKGLRFSYYFARRYQLWLFRLLLKLFPEPDQAPRQPPGFVNRSTMQALWALDQLQLFAISGRKASLTHDG